MLDPAKTLAALAFLQPNSMVATVFPCRAPLNSPMLAMLGHGSYCFQVCGQRAFDLTLLGIRPWVHTPERCLFPEYIPGDARAAAPGRDVSWYELRLKDLLEFDFERTYHPMYLTPDGTVAIDIVPALVADSFRDFIREVLTFARSFPHGRLLYNVTPPAPTSAS